MLRTATFAILFAITATSAFAQTGGQGVCGGAQYASEVRIAACTRLIDSGRLRGRDLAATYTHRGYQYLHNVKDFDRAIADLNAAIRADPRYSLAVAIRGDVYFEQRDYDRAIADYNEALRLDPKLYSAVLSRANAYAEKQDHHLAIPEYTAYIGVHPNDVAAIYSRGNSYFVVADYDRAIADYSATIRLEPKSATNWWARSTAYHRKKDLDRALSDINEAVRLDPKSAAYIADRGSFYTEKKDYARARADFEEALRLEPDNSSAIQYRAHLYYLQRDYDKAMQGWNEAIRLDPQCSLCWSNRSELHSRRGDFEKAIADANEALRLDAKNGWGYTMRGIALQGKRDFARALADLNEGIRLDPKDSFHYKARGDFHKERQDYNRAVADYEESIRLDTDFTIRADVIRLRDEAQRLARLPVPDSVALIPPKEQTVSPIPPLPPLPIGKRVALVMGNAEYKHVPALENPITDARTMRDTLEKLGFEVVYGENLDRRAMGRHIGEFGAIVKDAEAAIVYFAGHGSTFGDVPYVVPVDSKYEKLSDIPSELIQVETLVSELRRASGVRLVILDACRDNEREVELRRQDATARGQATRGGAVSRGLARLQNPDGLIVVYSTQHMTTAADGQPGSNSPFTGALAKHLASPGVDIKDVLFRAGQEVIAQTGGAQRPEISISLYDPFVLLQRK